MSCRVSGVEQCLTPLEVPLLAAIQPRREVGFSFEATGP